MLKNLFDVGLPGTLTIGAGANWRCTPDIREHINRYVNNLGNPGAGVMIRSLLYYYLMSEKDNIGAPDMSALAYFRSKYLESGWFKDSFEKEEVDDIQLISLFNWLDPQAFLGAAKDCNMDEKDIVDNFLVFLRAFPENPVEDKTKESASKATTAIDTVSKLLRFDKNPISHIENLITTGDFAAIGIKELQGIDYGFGKDTFDDKGNRLKRTLSSGINGVPDETWSMKVFNLLLEDFKEWVWKIATSGSNVFRTTAVWEQLLNDCLIFALNTDVEVKDAVSFIKYTMAKNAIPYTDISAELKSLMLYISLMRNHLDWEWKTDNEPLESYTELLNEYNSDSSMPDIHPYGKAIESIINLSADDVAPAAPQTFIPVVNAFGIMTIAKASYAAEASEYKDDEKATAKSISANAKADKKLKQRQDMRVVKKKVTDKTYSLYHKYQENRDEIDKSVSSILAHVKDVVANSDREKHRAEAIGGKEFSLLGTLRKVIGYAGVFAVNPVLGIITCIVRHYNGKKIGAQERRKALVEIEHEIRIVEEKFNDANAAGDTKAKYELMRIRNALDSARDSLISARRKAPDKELATARKALINVEVNSNGK